MRNAYEFRLAARNALRGHWAAAVIAGVIVSVLCGNRQVPEFRLNFTDGSVSAEVSAAGQTLFSTDSGFSALLTGAVVVTLLAALVVSVLYFLVGSAVSVGYARFNLDLTDGVKPDLRTLFPEMEIWKTAVLMRLAETVIIFFLGLLLVIPGIIAAYTYAMDYYILAEHPDLTAWETMQWSRSLMQGNRLRLFFLDLSFIGWYLLSFVTFGLSSYAVSPYVEAAHAAFYREISRTEVF